MHMAKIITYNQSAFLTLLIQGRCLYETYKLLNNKDFLLSKSNCLMPVNSILIKCKPIRPNISGITKLIKSGKKNITY